MKHLVERFRDGRIKAADFSTLQNWLDTEPEVPTGDWYKRFPTFILAGKGEIVKTFLESGMTPHGTEVK